MERFTLLRTSSLAGEKAEVNASLAVITRVKGREGPKENNDEQKSDASNVEMNSITP